MGCSLTGTIFDVYSTLGEGDCKEAAINRIGAEVCFSNIIGPGTDLQGTYGNDVFIVDGDQDVVINEPEDSTSIDIVVSSVDFTLTHGLEHLILTGNANLNGYGNELGNVMAGNNGNNSIYGAAGDDFLLGGNGQDSLYGETGNDTLCGGNGDDSLVGSVGNDVLIGHNGNDTMYGDSNVDHPIDWPPHGVDEVKEGRIVYDPNTESKPQFNDTLYGGNGNDLGHGGQGDDSIEGDAGNDTLFGDSGNDTINGGEGDDVIHGDGPAVNGGPSGNLLVNGSFEQHPGNYTATGYGYFASSIPGWTLNSGPQLEVVDSGHRGVNATDGNYWLDFDASPGNITISQTVAGAQAGHTYQLSFDAGDTVGYNGNFLQVFWGGQLIATIDPTTGALQHFTFNVIGGAGNGSNTLTFVGGGPADNIGISLDNVSLVHLTGSYGFGNDLINGGNGNDTIYGDGGNDTINGGNGNDLIYGDAGNDLIDGGNGNDVIYGDSGPMLSPAYEFAYPMDEAEETKKTATAVYDGLPTDRLSQYNDTINGGSGNDWVSGGLGRDLIDGDTGNDTLYGDNGSDTISGGDGNDTIFGGQGNDGGSIPHNPQIPDAPTLAALSGGNGNDYIDGGIGNDLIDGGNGNDTLIGGEGNDTISGDLLVTGFIAWGEDSLGLYNDSISGGAGDDVIDGQFGNDTITGDDGNDTINGGGLSLSRFGTDDIIDNDLLSGGNGDDSVMGDAGNDTITGDAGNDTLLGGDGDDNVSGGEGNDYLGGGAGNDFMTGGNGNDGFNGDAGNDTISGGEGNDTIYAGDGDDVGTGGNGNDTLAGDAGNDTMSGEAGNDYLNGGTGDDSLSGGDGNDAFNGESGNDTISGGEGNDLIYANSGNDIINGDAGNDTITGDEGNDSANGGTGNDQIYGGTGNDTLNGDAGNDTIDGGDGNDYITGGTDNSSTSNGPATSGFAGTQIGQVVTQGTWQTYWGNAIAGGLGISVIPIGGSEQAYVPNFGAPGQTTNVWSTSGIGVTGFTCISGAHGEVGYDPVTGTSEVMAFSFNQGPIDHADISLAHFFPAGTSDVYNELGAWHVYLNGVLVGSGTFSAGDISSAAGNGTFSIDLGGIQFDRIELSAVGMPQYPNDINADNSDFFVRNISWSGHGSEVNTIGDQLYGGAGNDTIYGGDGNDSIHGGADNDLVSGDAGNDTILGNAGTDTLSGGLGNDWAFGGAGNDTVYGDAGNDTVFGDAGNDSVYAGDGNDGMMGGQGNDYVNGGAGSDTMFGDGAYEQNSGWPVGEYYHDYVSPTADGYYYVGGDDTMDGGAGIDYMHGGDGNDLIYAGTGDDQLFGDGNNDTIYGDAGNDMAWAGTGNDVAYGGEGNDSISGDAGNDTLNGDNGNDLLFGDVGDDVIFGGAGNDHLLGHTGNDYLDGGLGNDCIDGGDGNDTIVAGPGFDTISGGAGADVFIFGPDSGNVVISDFTVGVDFINLNGLSMLGDQLDVMARSNGWWLGHDDSGNAVIHYGDHTITLLGVHEKELADAFNSSTGILPHYTNAGEVLGVADDVTDGFFHIA